MKGHVQDRWYVNREDEQGNSVREKTDLYGKGLRYKVRYYDPAGKERAKSFPDKQKRKADDFLLSMQHDVLTGRFIDSERGDMPVRDYSESWLKGQSQDGATQQMLRRRLNRRVYPKLGDLPLKAITADVLRDWLNWLHEEGLKASYRAGIFDIVSALLQSAKDDERIRTNPLRSRSIKRPREDKIKIKPWSETRVRKTQDALPDYYKVVVPIGAGTGMRQMEIFGFSPDDINRDEMELSVERQIKWIGTTPVFALPKCRKTRTVPVGEGVLEAIDDHMSRFKPRKITLPWEQPDGDPVTVRLLIDRRQDDLNIRAWYDREVWLGAQFTSVVWHQAVTAAGFDFAKGRDGMHALRHFFASMMLANGVSILEVAEYLGHSDPGYTLRVYTHLVPSSHRRARAASNRVFTPLRSIPDVENSSDGLLTA